jgi:hypothetical protein
MDKYNINWFDHVNVGEKPLTEFLETAQKPTRE